MKSEVVEGLQVARIAGITATEQAAFLQSAKADTTDVATRRPAVKPDTTDI